jgi:hypothetical protein
VVHDPGTAQRSVGDHEWYPIDSVSDQFVKVEHRHRICVSPFVAHVANHKFAIGQPVAFLGLAIYRFVYRNYGVSKFLPRGW